MFKAGGRWRALAAVVVLAAGAAACGDGGDDAEDIGAPDDNGAASATLEVTATDHAFDHAAEVAGGAVTIEAANEGEEDHVFIVQRIEDGKTFDEIKDLLADPEAEPPVSTVFGVAAMSPQASTRVTGVLEPGNYFFICPIPGADGVPHFAKGMLSPFTVTDGEGDNELGDAETSISGVEFSFRDVPEEFEAGEVDIEFTNEGVEEHELNLAALEPGKTIDDVIAFYEAPPGASGPQPMRTLGGGLIGAGVREPVVATYTFEAGKEYVFVCQVPDFSDGPPVPHAVKGMHSELLAVE